MKTNIFKSLVWVSAFLFISCSSDNDPVPNPCADTMCMNGGTCDDGSCNCPDGYYGEYCELQKTPASILITKAVVREFDNSNPQGDFWDNSASGYSPDIYLSLYRNNSGNFNPIFEPDVFYEDAISPGEFEFDINKRVTDLQSPYVFALFNYNGMDAPAADDQIIGQAAFYIYDSKKGFPSFMTVKFGTITVDLYLSYSW